MSGHFVHVSMVEGPAGLYSGRGGKQQNGLVPLGFSRRGERAAAVLLFAWVGREEKQSSANIFLL